MTRHDAVSALDADTRPLPLAVVHVRGSQAEMGAQHGRLLRQIGGWEATAAYYPRMVGHMLRGSALSAVERHAPTAMKPVLELLTARLEKHRPADLRARTDAFMRAAGQHPRAARHLLSMDVFQNAVGMAGRHRLGPFAEAWQQRAVPACSTLMAWGPATTDGRLLHARNFDFPGVGVWDMAPTVVFCTPDAGQPYAFATSRGADVPGITAWNASGLTVTAHTRLHRDVAFVGAAIVDLCHDIARKATTLAQAEAIVRERPVASTWGLAVSSAAEQRGTVIECHASGVAVTGPDGDAPWRTCTNHYLAQALQPGELAPSPGWPWHTHSRTKRLETAAREAIAGDPLDVASLFAWLGDGRDADVPELERLAGGVLGQSTSVQSVVVDPDREMLHLSVGRCPAVAVLRLRYRGTGQRRLALRSDRWPMRSVTRRRRALTQGRAWQPTATSCVPCNWRPRAAPSLTSTPTSRRPRRCYRMSRHCSSWPVLWRCGAATCRTPCGCSSAGSRRSPPLLPRAACTCGRRVWPSSCLSALWQPNTAMRWRA